ncbi:MAG: transcriptional repressor [Methanomassiliicoccales archaeon]|nr:transcriptional repressor [Methanomassiliicoccales archaeon]
MPGSPSRWTRQLKVIIDIVYSSGSPLDADEVYAEARKKLPSISLGTVYRNLNKLAREGLVSEIPKGSVQAFVRHPYTNAHFECERCGKLVCVPYELRISDIEKQTGMTVNRWSLRLTGLCRECEERRT